MVIYPEVFLSKWHLIVLFLTVIAFIGLRIGGYSTKTVMITTMKSFVTFYVAFTVIFTGITYDTKHMENQMTTWMDQTYEDNKGMANDHLAAFVGSFGDDADLTVKVYAGNYHQTKEFEGTVEVIVFDAEGEILKDETYEDITLDPGDKIEIDSYHSKENPDQFNYYFEP